MRLLPILVTVLFVRDLFRADSIGSVFDDYLQVVADPAHMVAELTFVLAEALILAPLVAIWVKRHDRVHHNETSRDRI